MAVSNPQSMPEHSCSRHPDGTTRLSLVEVQQRILCSTLLSPLVVLAGAGQGHSWALLLAGALPVQHMRGELVPAGLPSRPRSRLRLQTWD